MLTQFSLTPIGLAQQGLKMAGHVFSSPRSKHLRTPPWHIARHLSFLSLSLPLLPPHLFPSSAITWVAAFSKKGVPWLLSRPCHWSCNKYKYMSRSELLNTIMLLSTLSQGQWLHPVHGFGPGYTPDERATDLQCEDKGLFFEWNWRSPRKHLATLDAASRLDDLEMKNANNARLLQVSWQKWANTIHPFLDVSLPSPSLALSLPLSLPLRLPQSPVCSSTPHRWPVSRERWANGDRIQRFVSKRRTCLARLRLQQRCHTKSHPVQELEDKL